MEQSRGQKFRIREVPAGEAPLDVRKAWQGITLPLRPVRSSSLCEVGSESKSTQQEGYGCSVREAIAALFHAEQFFTAQWWVQWQQDYGISKNHELVFKIHECELVEELPAEG